MMRSQKYFVLAYLLFLIGLLASGSFPPPISEIVRALAYLLPPLLLAALLGKKSFDLTVCPPKIGARPLRLTLPLFFPTVLLLFGISALTSLLLGAFGLRSETLLTGGAAEIFLTYILFPALSEEFLFRYLPLSVLASYGKKNAVVFSALCFALTHCDFFQMPYAFAAGVLFAAIDLATGSILPSFLFHLCNNALSVLLLLYGDVGNFSLIFFSSLVLLSLPSLFFLFCKKEDYRQMFFSENDKKEKLSFTYSLFSLIVVCVFFAVCRLISLAS